MAEFDANGREPGLIGRREALALAAGLLALLPRHAPAQTAAQVAVQPAAAPALDRAAFLEASSLVTGMPAESLTGMADALFAAFQAHGPAILQLAALARQAPNPASDLAATLRGAPAEPAARALAAAWYTGMLGAGPAATLVSYDDALSWKAAGFEAVPGQCAGEFGFWTEAPPPTAQPVP